MDDNIMASFAKLYQEINRLEVKKLKREYNHKLIVYFMVFFIAFLFILAASASQ